MIINLKIGIRLFCKPLVFQVPRFPATGVRTFSETRFNMAAAKDLLSFVDASPTPFHVVTKAESILKNAGFKQVQMII